MGQRKAVCTLHMSTPDGNTRGRDTRRALSGKRTAGRITKGFVALIVQEQQGSLEPCSQRMG